MNNSLSTIQKLLKIGFIFFIIPCLDVYAGDIYNPAFLSDDPDAVTDLDYFKSGNVIPPGLYTVRLYLNDVYFDTIELNFIDNQGAVKPCIRKDLLEDLDINILSLKEESLTDDCLDLEKLIPGSGISFDIKNQSVSINVPQSSLNFKARGYIPPEHWDYGINAATVNYSFSGNNGFGEFDSNNYYLNLRSGLNLGAWRLRDYSTWSYGDNGATWSHINTYLQRDVVALKSRLLIGESFTNSDVFEPLNFRGISLESNDNMLPDSMRGFAPVVRGIAHGHAKVTVRQNSYVIYQTYVPAGPFEIRDLYPTSNSGDLQVSVEENDGGVNNYTVPYSAVPILQRDGNQKFNLSMGNTRGGHQQEKTRFLQTGMVFGLPYDFTLYGGTQFSEKYSSYAIGVGKNLGDFGALSADMTTSHSELPDGSKRRGYSTRFLYAKSLNSYGTNFQLLGYRYSTSGFYTLSDTLNKRMSGYASDKEDSVPESYFDLRYKKKDSMQINLSQQLGRGGSVFFTSNFQNYWDTTEKSRLLQIGYNGNIGDISYNFIYSYNKGTQGVGDDKMVSFGVSVPLRLFSSSTMETNNTYLSYNVSNSQNYTHHNVGMSGTLLDDNTLNYNVQQGYSNNGVGVSGGVSVGYQSRYGNGNVGYNYQKNNRQLDYNFSGGLLFHEGGVTLSQPINSNAVLVDVPDSPDIRIENSTGIYTDRKGYAVIPYATAYHKNRIALDTSSFNDRVDIEENVHFSVPTEGAITKVKFRPRIGNRVLFTLTKNGRPLPFGAIAADKKHKLSGIVDEEGVLYLSGVPHKGKLNVVWGKDIGKSCTADYSIPDDLQNERFVKLNLECHE
jgi:outer membrane usher protein